jgi:hypothetical protein
MQQLVNLDFNNIAQILNLPIATTNGQPIVFQQLQDAIQGLAWKDDVRVKVQSNVNLASPGAVLDGETMSVGDRFFPGAQTLPAEQGIFIWNGAAVAATRSFDMNASSEFNNAVFTVNAGTDAGTSYRITALNPTVDTTAITYANFGQGATQATETLAGVAEIATQAETDAGTDDLRFLTPLKLAAWVGKVGRFEANFGDGTATAFTITHNLSSKDCVAEVRRVSDDAKVGVDVAYSGVNALVVTTAPTVPTTNQYRVVVKR